MKKIISILLLVIVIMSLCSLTVSAQPYLSPSSQKLLYDTYPGEEKYISKVKENNILYSWNIISDEISEYDLP